MTFAWVLNNKKPVPSNSFINDPVRESRPSAKRARRCPLCKYSAMCFTAYGEVLSIPKVRELIITLRCNQLFCAVVLDVTHFQSSSTDTRRNNQSNQETWFGISSTGPGVFRTASL